MERKLERLEIVNLHNGIRGDLSGIRGDVDKCGITEEERENRINIEDLIKN